MCSSDLRERRKAIRFVASASIAIAVLLGVTGAHAPTARAQSADMQDEIAADFPGAEHVRVPDSGHYIQRDHPEVVVGAARELAGCTSDTHELKRK